MELPSTFSIVFTPTIEAGAIEWWRTSRATPRSCSSASRLSSRLGEVSKEEEARRDTLQEAELRAAVGEYDEGQWESLRAEANRELDKIAGDRASLEGQLAELESIRKLSELTAPDTEAVAAASGVPVASPVAAPPTPQVAAPPPRQSRSHAHQRRSRSPQRRWGQAVRA